MLRKYFRFTKKNVTIFLFLMALIVGLQIFLTGSMLSKQKVTVEAGNSQSAVIGILDKTEIVRQKFQFKRKVVLSEFALSFGSFLREEVGDTLHVQMTDASNSIVYETDIDVDSITPNASYRIPMEHTVTIPKNAVCCIKITCSSKNNAYDTIPTLNTTNRTDPNTYMSTMSMQTRKKCLTISYTYYYRQLIPLIVLIFEMAFLFFLCFERITQYGMVFRKKKEKQQKQNIKAQKLAQEAKEKRLHTHSESAKIKYSKENMQKKAFQKKKGNYQKKHNPKQRRKDKSSRSLKDFVKWCLIEPAFIRGVRIFVTVINPLLVMFFIELLNDALLTKAPMVWIFTWILLLAVQYVLFAVIGNMSIAMLILDCILFPSGLANLILMNVRGTPFLPGDLLALATATEVASTYKITLTPMQFVMLPAFIIWCFFILRLNIKKGKKQQNAVWKRILIKRAAPLVGGCLAISILYRTPILEKCNIQDNVWNKVSSCRTNGFFLNFFINLHYLSVSEPSGYSQQAITEIVDEFEEETKETVVAKKETDFDSNRDFSNNTSLNGQKPNIILIMNESLADFDLIGETNFNRDPLEFIHSLKENTIYGKDYVSIYGAGTSNSEFEAMTGNSMKFFPSGCNVYQQFMHDETYSMAYYLKSLGYSTKAIHPSSGENWNRINTYESMHFDEFITIDDFENPEYVRYISDKESYKKVIELYEQKEEGTPLFAFDMTIQNHGGYLTNTNWENPVYVKGAYYQETKEFLSATKVSDDAFAYLIDYFEKQEEPTIICMFGDHHPSIEVEFYEELLGKDQEDWELEDIQKRYATPFIIWANYDIEESTNAVVSNNYLENLVLKQAGIELPLYNQYIEKVSESIPAMNVNGYMDFNGIWHDYDDEKEETTEKLIHNYELLQYGYYSDTDKKSIQKIFKINQ